jgi:CheY-like chemotaxis protein
MNENLPAVLLVDDQPKLARLVAELLKRLGFSEVDIVNDGLTALDMLRSRRYGLIFCDLDMQPIDGLDLLKQVRRTEAFESIPFIITESTITFEQVTSAYAAGVDAFLLKPYDLPLLKAKLKSVLSKPVRKKRRNSDWLPAGAPLRNTAFSDVDQPAEGGGS